MSNAMEHLQHMIQQIDNLMVQGTETRVRQEYIASAVDNITKDVGQIKETVNIHTTSIEELKREIADHKSSTMTPSIFTSIKEFGMNHPIFALMFIIMGINIILVSIGVPIIDVMSIYNGMK